MATANWEEIKDKKQKIYLVLGFLAETVLTFCQLAAASPVLELHPQLDGNQTLQTETYWVKDIGNVNLLQSAFCSTLLRLVLYIMGKQKRAFRASCITFDQSENKIPDRDESQQTESCTYQCGHGQK